MRLLEKEEIKSKDCSYCLHCFQGIFKEGELIGYEQINEEVGSKRKYCEYKKCPYTKEDFNIDISEILNI